MSPHDRWQKLVAGSPCERSILFAVPSSDRVVVVSYEGMRDTHLGPPLRVETDDERHEGFLSGRIAASFSADGRLLVVATPSSLSAHRR